jgi:hypothetical protein
MNLLLLLIIVVLIVVCAGLWYAVRTHKSLPQLEGKVAAKVGTAVEASLAAKFEAFKAEAVAAAEAAKTKL